MNKNLDSDTTSISNTSIVDVDTSSNNRETVAYIQKFTVSSISILNLLQTVLSDALKSDPDIRGAEKFISSSQKFIDQMKSLDEDFNYLVYVKKAFKALNNKEQYINIKNKDPELFSTRNEENKIVTIIFGIDLRVGYKFLSEDQIKTFWQYMYLFIDSVFCLIRIFNPSKFSKYDGIDETLTYVEAELAKTGVMFNNQVFNPFIGIVNDNKNYGVEHMFTGGELPKQQQISIESFLTMLGVNKLFDEKKLNEELKSIGTEQINEATEKIVGLLGAKDNKEIKETCNTLIKEIVSEFKENGIGNIGDTLKKVAESAKKTIDITKMKKTGESMHNFMTNSQDKLKEMKDSNGNPIGQQMLNSMAIPLSMMKFMQPNKNTEESPVKVDKVAKDTKDDDDNHSTASKKTKKSKQ